MAQKAIHLPDPCSPLSPVKVTGHCRVSSAGEGQRPAFGLPGSRLPGPPGRRAELKRLLRRHRHHNKMMTKNKRLSGKTGTENGQASALKAIARRYTVLVARPVNMEHCNIIVANE